MKKIIAMTALSTMTTFSIKAIEIPNPELILKLKSGVNINSVIKSEKNIQNLFANVYIVRSQNNQKLYQQLKKNPNLEYVELGGQAEKTLLPVVEKTTTSDKGNKPSNFNDPQVSKVWSFLDASENGISIDSAYRQFGTTNTSEIIVAVVDTGVDTNHEDLKANIWINKNEIPGNGIDDDQNGYIDDINGINTLIRDNNGKATVNVIDTHSHGTHVSGTIAAVQNNKIGIAGIASKAKIMAIRTVPNNGDERDVDVAEAFIYAAKNGAKIINCSFGKSKNEGKQLIPDTLKYIADNYGVLVIAAAGNESSDIDKNPTYPASFNNENLLIVSSTSASGAMSYFSNFGKVNSDVATPGSSIYSTVPGNKYNSMSGTSMASPTTAGVAAEIWSHYPELNYTQIKEVLMKSVTPVEKFKSKMVSGGRIDLLNGLEYARSL